ncbi:MAG: S41 family peptidase [Candidatus Pacebacteria bacterium]|nr:S41 family peptidase [Candidatus Paceibacterota bacterium]
MENNSQDNKKKLSFKMNIFLAIFLIFLAFAAGRSSIIDEPKGQEIGKSYETEIVNKYQDETGNFIKEVDFDLYWQVWDELQAKYFDADKIKESDLFYGSLKGMVSAVGDPYTSFLDPELSRQFSEEMSGSFEGIGAEIGIRDDILTIIAPLPETPASKAGILAGDKIYEINGESTMGISIDEAVSQIRGEKGTEVILTVYRDSFDQPQEITIIRDTIQINSVKTEVLEDNIFLITINSFNDDTLDLFNQAIKEAQQKNVKGIILDLRNNPGGYLDTAIEVASEWVESGPVVIEKFDEVNEETYLARGIARLADYKTVVLVNGGSASASEIVSGALQDYSLATVIGTQTFGKGSVQTLNPFADGSALKVTVAKWLTPEGNYITDVGITPDKVIEYSPEDFENKVDPQLEEAVKTINNK